MSRPPTLLQLAARHLSTGPAHTLDLAREVLELRGNPAAASKAVFTLLGTDDRFAVDREGVWSLRFPSKGVEKPLSLRRYAVVDVETTGGSWRMGDRITEVAIVEVEGGVIREGYETLIHPGRRIPPMIQRFTGITDEMVAKAPPFEGVAEVVRNRLDGRIFTAHNRSFDWGFLSNELLTATGDFPEVEHLCTVRLGRLLLPRLRRHGLDALTTHFGIRVHHRHRAMGDAWATALLLLRLLEEADGRGIHDPALLGIHRLEVH